MTHYIICDEKQQIHLISYEELDIALARGCKELYNGTEKQCERYYDDMCEDFGYTGPIWNNTLELNLIE